jgi:hypothetical protein
LPVSNSLSPLRYDLSSPNRRIRAISADVSDGKVCSRRGNTLPAATLVALADPFSAAILGLSPCNKQASTPRVQLAPQRKEYSRTPEASYLPGFFTAS